MKKLQDLSISFFIFKSFEMRIKCFFFSQNNKLFGFIFKKIKNKSHTHKSERNDDNKKKKRTTFCALNTFIKL